MITVNWYGCTKCQKQHFERIEPTTYEAHKSYQSKHGIQERLFITDALAAKWLLEIKEITESNKS